MKIVMMRMRRRAMMKMMIPMIIVKIRMITMRTMIILMDDDALTSCGLILAAIITRTSPRTNQFF